jgi:hypothetical protein
MPLIVTRRSLSAPRFRAVIPGSDGPTPARWASKSKFGQSPDGTGVAEDTVAVLEEPPPRFDCVELRLELALELDAAA